MSRMAVFEMEGEIMLAAFGPIADMGATLFTMLGEDAPFWPFESISTLPVSIITDELGMDADFTGAPKTSTDYAAVNTAISALFSSPPPVGAVTGSKVWGKSNPPT